MTETGKRRRGRRPADEAERKDRIIQTRVPKDLESTLKEAAERERVSVSHLIRNVLEDTFNLVDNIVADSAQLVDTVRRDAMKLAASARGEGPRAQPGAAPATPSDPLAAVEAWQDVIVNQPTVCIQCQTPLKRGAHAFRGVSAMPGAASVWLCPACLETL